jgi:hypothetical protein
MMERNALSSSKCTEDNEQDHLTDQESGIYSDSELSSPQRSQKESHKRHHAESTVRSAYPYSALNLHEPQHQSNYRYKFSFFLSFTLINCIKFSLKTLL